MRQWSKSQRPVGASIPASAGTGAGRGCAGARDDCTAVVKDARLHDALQSMYIPPSLLRIGGTIGRGLYNVLSRLPQADSASSLGREITTGQHTAIRCVWGSKAGGLNPLMDKHVGGG